MSGFSSSDDKVWKRGAGLPATSIDSRSQTTRGPRNSTDRYDRAPSAATASRNGSDRYGKAPSASTASLLTEESLKRANLGRDKFKSRSTDDETASVSSYSSIATFQSTLHSRIRLQEREIDRESVGKAIKRGKILRIDDEKAMIVHENIIAIVAESEVQALQKSELDEIKTILSNKRILVTAWKFETDELDTPEEYATHALLLDCWNSCCSVIEAGSDGEAFIEALQLESSKHSPERFAAILNFEGLTSNAYMRFTFLHLAVWSGLSATVESLLSLGASPNILALTKKQYPPLFYAFSSKVPDIVRNEPFRRNRIAQLILEAPITSSRTPFNVNHIANNVTALQKAVYIGAAEAAQLLLNHGADPDIKQSYESARELALIKGMDLVYPALIDGQPPSHTSDESQICVK